MIKKLISKTLIFFVYRWALLFYDKKYLVGKWFSRDGFTKGWQQVLNCWYGQKVKGINKHVPWPVPESVQVGNPDNIEFNPDDMDNFWSVGCYFQALGAKLIIKKGTIIAPGVGLITANHDLNNYLQSQEGKPVIIGENCWIGMNAVILPGVELGDHTIVGAGAIVTKSYPEGYCVLVGNPARPIKKVVKDENGQFTTQ